MAARAKFANARSVQSRRITRVLLPAIMRKLSSQLLHQVVAVRFGQHRRRSYAHKFGISFDNTRMRNKRIRCKTVAIH